MENLTIVEKYMLCKNNKIQIVIKKLGKFSIKSLLLLTDSIVSFDVASFLLFYKRHCRQMVLAKVHTTLGPHAFKFICISYVKKNMPVSAIYTLVIPFSIFPSF